MPNNTAMTPREIVAALDEYIIGQDAAKRAVANSVRSRWRRMQVADEKLRKEITPKNILMIGPTGSGKTELARRLATLVNAPFIKVEATKFTEVGYVGRDVDSIVRDLMEVAYKKVREEAVTRVKERAEKAAIERILDVMVPRDPLEADNDEAEESATRKTVRKHLQEGKLDEKEIEMDIGEISHMQIMGPPGMEDMTSQLQSMMSKIAPEQTKRRKIKVKEARKMLTEQEAAKMINDEEIRAEAVEVSEQNSIVFIDEFDKIVKTGSHGADVSREGVQRDLLPLIEGCTVSTKYGMIKTDHILFVTSGAFQLAKPSDLIPELQGRLPIRVELKALTADDFEGILKSTKASLIDQYRAMLNTEKVDLVFTDDAIRAVAEIAYKVNERTENIGARRLYTIMERLLEQVSFEATDRSGETITIDKTYVKKQLNNLVQDEDLSRYIL